MGNSNKKNTSNQLNQNSFPAPQLQSQGNNYYQQQSILQLYSEPPAADMKDEDALSTNTGTANPKDKKSFSLEEIKSKVTLSLKLKHQQLKVNYESVTRIPMLATIETADCDTASTAIDLVCVLDISGSMGGEKIDLVKKVFPVLFEYLTPNDRLSIVAFNSGANLITPLLLMNESGRSKTLLAVNYLQASGGTNTSSGLTLALEVLKSRKQENTVTGIFILSDGVDNLGKQLVANAKTIVQNYASNEKTREYSISTFGFGKDNDAEVLRELANVKEGNYYFVEQLSQVDEAFADCLVGLQSILAQDVEFEIQAVDNEALKGVKITKGFGQEGFWKTFDGKYYAQLKSIVSGKSRNLVLELEIPAFSKDQSELLGYPLKVAGMTVNMTALTSSGKEKFTVSTETNIVFSDSNSEEDLDVMFNYFRISFADVLILGKSYSDARNFTKAQEVFKQLKDQLLQYKDERIVSLIKDVDVAIEGSKEKTYEHSGQKMMRQNIECYYNESSNVNNNVMFQNCKQMEANVNVKMMKNSKR